MYRNMNRCMYFVYTSLGHVYVYELLKPIHTLALLYNLASSPDVLLFMTKKITEHLAIASHS